MKYLLSSLRIRILLLLSLTFLVMLSMAGYLAIAERADNLAKGMAGVEASAEQIAVEQNNVINYTQQFLTLLLRTRDIREFGSTARCPQLLSEVLKREPRIANISLAAPNGDLVCNATPPERPDNIADRAHYKSALAAPDLIIEEPILSRSTGKWGLPFAKAIRNEAGQVQGVLVVLLDLQWVNSEFAKSKYSAGATFGLIDNKGTVLARYPDPEIWIGRNASQTPFFKALIARDGTGVDEELGFDGVRRIYGLAHFAETTAGPIYLWVGRSKESVTAFAEREFAWTVGGALVLLALLFGAIWFGGERLVLRPIFAIVGAARRLGQGDHQARTGLRYTNDELGQLARSFDDMAVALSSESELLKLNRALRVLSECNSILVHAKEERELLDDVCRVIVEAGGYRMAWVGFAEQDEAKTVRPVAHYGHEEGYLDAVRITWADTERGRGPTGTAIRTGITQVNQNYLANPQMLPWRAEALKRGYQASIALPLGVDGNVRGALAIYAAETDAFEADETKLLEKLADNLAFGIAALKTGAERDRAIEELEFKNTILLTQQETSLDAILLVDENARILSYNRQFVELWGIPEQMVTAGEHEPVLGFVRARTANPDAFLARVNYLYEHRQETSREEIRLSDGRTIDRYSAPVISSAGKYYGRVWYFRDITESKRADQLLRLEHTVARCLADADNASGGLKAVIRTVCETQNWERGSYWRVDETAGVLRFGETWNVAGAEFERYAEDSRNVVFAPGVGVAGRVWQSGEPLWIADPSKDPRVLRKTLSREASMFVFPVISEGRTIGVLAFFSREARAPDTRLLAATRVIGSQIGQFLQRKRAEEAQAQLAAIVENANDAIISRSLDGTILTWNAGAERLYGYSAGEAIGQPITMIVRPEDQADAERTSAVLAAGGQVPPTEVVRRTKDGRLIDVLRSVSPIKNDAGQVVGGATIARDITERKQAEVALRASERRFRALIENSADAIVVLDPSGKVIYGSPATVRILGYGHGELAERSVFELVHEDDLPALRGSIKELLGNNGATVTMQARMRHKDGSWRMLDGVFSNMSADPAIRGIIANYHDSTERQRRVEEMSTFRAAMDVTADAIYLVDRASMRFIDVNEAACRMQGRSRDELLALGPAGVLLISREELERTYNSIVTGGAATKPQEILRQGKDGSQVWIELRSSARRSGERWTIVTVARDITERKRTEERVRKLSHAVEQSPAATVITDTEGRFEYVNRKFLEVTGYAWEELIGRTPTVTKSGLTPVEVYQGLWRTILAGGEWRGEMQNRKKNGDLYWEYEVISPLKNERGEIVNFIAIKEDITERKEAEENLRASELRFRQMEENIRDVFFLLDADGTRMLYASPAYEDIWGRTRESLYANSESWTEAIHPEDMASVRENYKQGMSVGKAEDEFRIVRADGSIRWVELRAFPVRDDAGKIVRIAGVAKDITERKRTEAALQEELVKHQETARELFDARVWLAETDRQEAVGRLAAGVAHEVKNPLAIIRLGVDYLSKEFARESNEAAVLDKVQQAVIRADTVITDLLQFSRKKSLARHPTQINAVIDNAINLTRHEITLHNIEIVRSYDDSMPPILADPDQLAQVFVNLLSNAAHAIGQGGRIEVVARSRCLSERDLERDATRTFRLGERVITAEIRDSGPGISPENEKRLFEPFFTTKPIGEGTGLGLAVSRNIVIMHEGSINLSNRPEGGASAFLMFPAAIEGSANEAAHTGGG